MDFWSSLLKSVDRIYLKTYMIVLSNILVSITTTQFIMIHLIVNFNNHYGDIILRMKSIKLASYNFVNFVYAWLTRIICLQILSVLTSSWYFTPSPNYADVFMYFNKAVIFEGTFIIVHNKKGAFSIMLSTLWWLAHLYPKKILIYLIQDAWGIKRNLAQMYDQLMSEFDDWMYRT